MPLARRWLDVLALIGLNLLIFSGFYSGADTFPFDFGATYYALPAYWIASISGGEWPGWVPYLGMGYPFAAQPQSGFFYPVFWLFAALRLPYTLHAASSMQAVHVAAGALGMYLLAGRLYGSRPVAFVAGCAYMVFGGFYSNAQHPDIVRAFSLLPWLLWAFGLEPDRMQPRRIAGSAFSSAASWSTLAIPALVYLLSTGAYPGTFIAFLFVLPLFLLAQAVRNIQAGQPTASAVFDLAVVSSLLAIGLALAAGYLVPLASFSRDLTRSTDFLSQQRWLFQLRDGYELVLSSTYLRPKDNSMYAMQLPLALIPFVLYVRRATLVRLAPHLAVAGAAILMSFDVFGNASAGLIHVLPFLGYSRFAVADYRAFIAIALLLCLCGGLARVRTTSRRRWALVSTYALGLSALLVLLAPAMRLAWLAGTGDFATTVLLLQLAPAMVLGAWFAVARSSSAFWLSVTVATVLSSLPVLFDLGGFWHVRGGEATIEKSAGISPWADGRWRVDDLFVRQLTSRPARSYASNEFDVSWQGYLSGEFMMGDYGGAILRARKAIEDDAELRAFAELPSTLFAVPCAPGDCATRATHVSVSATDPHTTWFTWSGLEYGRSWLRYHVSLTTDALVVENELFSPGWRGHLSTGQSAEPVQVDGGLRGWILPPGDYDLELSFGTPYLAIALGISALALAVYVLCVVAFARAGAAQPAPVRLQPKASGEPRSTVGMLT